MDYSIMYPHCHSSASGSSSSALSMTRQPSLPSASNPQPPLPIRPFPTPLPSTSALPLPKRTHTNPLQTLETRLSAFLWACDEGTHGGALDRSTSSGECYWSGNAGLRGNIQEVGARAGMERGESRGLSTSPHTANSPYTSLSSSSSSTHLDASCPHPPALHHSSTSPASLPTHSTILDAVGLDNSQTHAQKDLSKPFGHHAADHTSGSGLTSRNGKTVKGFETIREYVPSNVGGGDGVANMAHVGMRRGTSLDVGRATGGGANGGRGRFNPSVDPRLLGI